MPSATLASALSRSRSLRTPSTKSETVTTRDRRNASPSRLPGPVAGSTTTKSRTSSSTTPTRTSSVVGHLLSHFNRLDDQAARCEGELPGRRPCCSATSHPHHLPPSPVRLVPHSYVRNHRLGDDDNNKTHGFLRDPFVSSRRPTGDGQILDSCGCCGKGAPSPRQVVRREPLVGDDLAPTIPVLYGQLIHHGHHHDDGHDGTFPPAPVQPEPSPGVYRRPTQHIYPSFCDSNNDDDDDAAPPDTFAYYPLHAQSTTVSGPIQIPPP
ncbi:hypothetical protein VTJ49DRAFT_1779 [Mycothermus thermophilus]|uniref:Uncharacterized protein n=1 Tax=Humicola insolens TaxID=85995 RepID=A0ABR3VNF9_HUMIN